MNWGYRLLCTFIVFIAGMGYLVYRAMTTDFELVEKEYYKTELNYQQVIDGTKLANELPGDIELSQTSTTLSIAFPGEVNDAPITGNIWFYCAYDSKKDKHFELSPANGVQELDIKTITSGNYTLKIKWNCGEKKYYSEKQLSVL